MMILRSANIIAYSLKNLGKIRIFRAATEKSWVKSESVEQAQEATWAKQIFCSSKMNTKCRKTFKIYGEDPSLFFGCST